MQVAPAGYNMSTVEVDGTVIVSPKRSWLFPPSLLLPDIPIRATIKLGVRGPLQSGQVGSTVELRSGCVYDCSYLSSLGSSSDIFCW